MKENARKMGDYIFSRTADWTSKFKIVGDVRGKGLMIGIEFVRDQRTKERAGELAQRDRGQRVPQGIAGARCGRKLPPPLAASPYRRGAGRLRCQDARRLHPRSEKNRFRPLRRSALRRIAREFISQDKFGIADVFRQEISWNSAGFR